MVDQNSQFYAILTNVGAAKQANADALGIAWKITHMGVGDANGADPTPDATQTRLINEWRRAPLNQLKVDDKDASIIIAEQVIPADIGGKWIREIGLYDEAGDLVAVANCAPTYKPVLSQGSGRTQVLRMSLVVSSAANVQLKIDPSVVLATREWVTEELARQDFKHSVLAATTANIALSGLQTIDGVPLTAGARVLVKNQTTARDNGLYTVVPGAAWSRCDDANSSAKVTPGLLVLVEKGTVNSDSAWQLVTDAPITLGVTALSFEMAFGRSGVAAGTYRSVQVDKYGRVVAATNPTTVAGYGITDVYTKSETFSRAETTSAIATAVASAVAGLVDSSPAALDTLKELAMAIGNDPNFATTMVNELAKKANLASPKLTGTPEAPTAQVGTNTDQLATMKALLQALASFGLASGRSMFVDDLNTLRGTCFFGFGDKAIGAIVSGVYDAIGFQIESVGQRTQFAVPGGARLYVRTDDGSDASGFEPWTEIASVNALNLLSDIVALKSPIASPAFTGTPTAPTAPLGTNNTQLATMAALLQGINAYKRNYGGNVVGVGANITLLGSQTGYAFNVTAPVTVSLPAAADAGSGGTYVIRNVSSGVVNINAPANGKIVEKNNTVNSAPLQVGEWVELQASTTNYFINKRGTLSEIGKVVSDAMASFGIGGYNVKSGVDINTLTQGGLSYCINPTNSPVGTQGQSSANGYLLSFQYMDGSAYCAQVFIPSLVGASLDTMHFRRMTAGTWSGWKTLATTEGMQLALAAVGLGTSQAPLCTDVDAQATSGFFYLQIGSSANMPYLNNGFLLQFPWNGNSAALQFYVAASVDKLMYRAKSSGTWRDWKDIPSLDGVIGAISNNSRSFRPQAAVGLATSQALNTTTHMGALFQFNANALTVTLPSSVSVTAGMVVTLRNPRASTQTLAVASGSIVEEGGTSDKLSLQAYEWIELTSSGSNWFVSARGKVKEVATLDQLTSAIASATPPGMVGHFALTAPPPGWLKRNGAAVSRITYAALFTAVGTQFGAGDGSTTFNLPDDRELVDRAWTDGLNSADLGRALFSAQADQLGIHNHTGTVSAGGAHSHTTTVPRERIDSPSLDTGGNAVLGDYQSDGPQILMSSTAPNHSHGLTINASGGNETRMANRAYLACIKY